MKKAIYILIGLLSFTSCQNDVLDKVPLDIITENSVWSSPELIEAYLAQVYVDMTILSNEAPGHGWPDGEDAGGAFYIHEVSDESQVSFFYTGQKFGGLKNGSSMEWWESAYKLIRSLNIFIEKLPTSTVEATQQKKRIAEARFLRAFNYFAMVKRYGGVPLLTVSQNINDAEEALYPKREKEQVVYDFILSEMDAVAEDLPKEGYSGRPTKYTALALKCRAALYAGSIAQFGKVELDGVLGIPASMAPAYYQKAYDTAKLIIDSGSFSLYNKNPDKVKNFRNLFIEKNNSEVIWAKKHDFTNLSTGGNGWTWDFFQSPVPNAWGAGNTSGIYLEMAEAFENADGTSGKLDREAVRKGLWTMEQLWGKKEPRFFASIYTNLTPWKGSKIDMHYGIQMPDGTVETKGSSQGVLAVGINTVYPYHGFGIMKYLDEGKDSFSSASEIATSGTDYIIFRYGEVLLNYAEAAFELGKNADALAAINQIRDRGGVTIHKQIDREKIHHERRIELAFEGQRYWDSRRWRAAVSDFSRSFSDIQYIQDVATGKFKININENIDGNIPAFFPENYYFRVGMNRIGNNKNLVENPGYN